MLERLRRNLAWRAELKSLDAQLAREPAPTLDAPTPGKAGELVWRLPVPGKPDAFMAITAGHADHDLFVVPVRAAAFHRAWLAGGLQSDERPDGCRLRNELATDNKYRHAAVCFADSAKNAVGLPRVGVEHERGRTGVRFTDGITRTFWLLANQVAAFPVVVAGPESAAALAKVAGIGAPLRVSELFAATREAPAAAQEARVAVGAGEGRGQAPPRPAPRLARPRGSRGQGAEL